MRRKDCVRVVEPANVAGSHRSASLVASQAMRAKPASARSFGVHAWRYRGRAAARHINGVPASRRADSVGVLFFLIPLALVVVTAAVLAFRWALADGQFDDLDTPSLRVLTDDAASTAIDGCTTR